MADVQVTCITKPYPQSPHEHITHLGNPRSSSGGWMWTREQVIASIDAQTNTFYVLDAVSGKRADIGVVREAGKAPYVRTYADGRWSNNLCLSINAACKEPDMTKPMKPGENTGTRGGIFQEVGPRGGRQPNFSTVPDNRQLPPTTKPGHAWTPVKITPNSNR